MAASMVTSTSASFGTVPSLIASKAPRKPSSSARVNSPHTQVDGREKKDECQATGSADPNQDRG